MKRTPLALLALLGVLLCVSVHSARISQSLTFEDFLAAKPVKEHARNYDDEEPGESLEHSVMLSKDPAADNFCKKNKYRKRTLKVVREIPFIGLFPNLKGQRRFEASGITFAKDAYWVVFDNLYAIGKLDLKFNFRGPENALIGPVQEDSQFEGIAYMPSTDTFLAVRESFDHDEHGLVPVTMEMKIIDDHTYKVVRFCPIKFELEDDNKGFESIYYWEEPSKHGNGELDRYVMGLCESNFCATNAGGHDAPGRQRGNGRVVVAKFNAGSKKDDPCSWDVVKVINIPESAYLMDYAAISFDERKGSNVAIVSQEDAAVWVGKFDWQAMDFVEGEGTIYHFPRDEDCAKIYCNVEGIAWLDASRIVVTSDKAKSSQDHRCMAKDQSVHVMALP